MTSPLPGPFSLVPFVSVDDMMRLVLDTGIERMLCDLADYIEADFRRWESFDKTPRIAAHSEEGVIELMPTSDGQAYGFKYVNGHPKNTRSGRQTVTAFGVLADVDTGYPLLLTEMTILTALRTAATSAMAAKWLAPRIRDFIDLYPNLDVTLLSYVSVDDVLEEGVDIAISFAREKQADIGQDILLQDELWPVCAPSLLKENAPISSAGDLALYPILHTTLEGLDFGASWDDWSASADLPRIEGRRSLSFSRGYMMLEAILKGQGIGIAMRTLVETDVAGGRLLRLLDHRCKASKLLALFYLEAAQNRPAVRSFRSWMRERLVLERAGSTLGGIP